MYQTELGSTPIFLVALTSFLCVVVSLSAVFFGGIEEKVLSAIVAVAAVFCMLQLTIAGTHEAEVRSVELVLSIFELFISLWVALKTKEFWPLIVAAMFLVKACAVVAQYFRFPVGVFGNECVQIFEHSSIALIILAAMLVRNKKRDAVVDEHDRLF